MFNTIIDLLSDTSDTFSSGSSTLTIHIHQVFADHKRGILIKSKKECIN
jgi:hypothetical protein